MLNLTSGCIAKIAGESIAFFVTGRYIGVYQAADAASPPAETVQLAGELSIEDVAELKDLFEAAIARGHDVALDCAAILACDASVLQLICAFHKTAAQNRQGFRIPELPPAIHETAAQLGISAADLGAVSGDQSGAH